MGEGSGVVTVSPGLAREGKEVQAGPGSTWGVCNAEPGPGGWGGGCPPTAPPLRGTDLFLVKFDDLVFIHSSCCKD